MMNRATSVKVLESYGLLSWPTLLTGWKRGWVTKADIERFALTYIEGDIADADLSAVATLTSPAGLDDDAILELLAALVRRHPEDAALALDKWRLAMLIELEAARINRHDKQDRLDELWAEFGYPEDMRRCSQYGPSDAAIDAGLASRADLTVDPLAEMSASIERLKHRLGVQ